MKLRAQRHRALVHQRHAPATLTLRRRGGLVVLIHRRGQLRSAPRRPIYLADIDSPGGPLDDFLPLAQPRTAIIPR